MSKWQPPATVPKDGTPFQFFTDENDLVYVGRYGKPRAGNVQDQLSLCYFSYTDTSDKTYFRLGGMIRCGFRLKGWQPMAKAPS